MSALFTILTSVIALAMAVGVPVSVGCLIASYLQKEVEQKKKMRRLATWLFVVPVGAFFLTLALRYIYLNL